MLVFGGNCYARSEYEIKAAYLYNFIKFVSWTSQSVEAAGEINVCILGKDPFQELIDPINGKKIQGKPIKLFKFESMKVAPSCTVIFISSSERKGFENILMTPALEHALTVSDIEDFAKSGGMIGFVQVGNVIRFEINLDSARKSGVDISSKLLELAQEVYQ